MTCASVVVPAYNEERGLRRCLETLLADAGPQEFEVVVVANGCTDGTADVAREFAERGARCIETEIASKANAIALGDSAAESLPRIYLDADVVITTSAARAMARALTSGGYLAAAPRLRIDGSQGGPLTRAYIRVLESLPVFASGYVGSGCYALSADGRARFQEFPQIIGDDKFVNELFEPAEKITLLDHELRTTAPRTLRGVIRRGLRVRAGSLQLDAQRSKPPADTGTGAHIRALARSPRTLLDASDFVLVQVYTMIFARLRQLLRRDQTWLRDDSSRR